jgi:HEAT repeat protein
MDREIVETILLNTMEVATAAEIPGLLRLLRFSGLLDMRIYEAQASRGWQRQRALVSLGRMRAPEAIPALTEALDDTDTKTRAAAVRGLGRTGLLEAARQILECMVAGRLRMPAAPVQIALVNCCRSQPELLLPYLRRAEGETRELLARVLGELATPDMVDDLLLLAGDPLPEVRASTARALGEAKPGLALRVLSALAHDPEWFVRLRAVAALGGLEDPRAIPALVEALCDANRYVRLRAATSLVRLDLHLEEVLERVVETRDSYALQTLVSELERSGQIRKLVDRLSDPARRDTGAEFLLDALRAGSQQLRNVTATALKSEEVIG